MIKNKASVEFRIFDHKSKFGTLIYEKDAIVRLHRNSLVGVEIGTSVLSLKLITK